MISRKSSMLVKFLVILIAELSLLFSVNLLSMYLKYTPGTVVAYLTSGGLVAYVVSLLFDKVVLRKKTKQEAEIEELKKIVYSKFPVNEEEQVIEEKAERVLKRFKRRQ